MNGIVLSFYVVVAVVYVAVVYGLGDFVGYVGDTSNLTCTSVTPEGSIGLSWYLENDEGQRDTIYEIASSGHRTRSDRYQVDGYTGTLSIYNTNSTDAGKYKCTISYEFIIDEDSTLTVYDIRQGYLQTETTLYAVNVTDALTNYEYQQLVVGNVFFAKVIAANCNPPARIEWWINGSNSTHRHCDWTNTTFKSGVTPITPQTLGDTTSWYKGIVSGDVYLVTVRAVGPDGRIWFSTVVIDNLNTTTATTTTTTTTTTTKVEVRDSCAVVSILVFVLIILFVTIIISCRKRHYQISL